jgi:hypothetical protein
MQTRMKRLKKTKKPFFYQCALELHFATIMAWEKQVVEIVRTAQYIL